MRRVLLIAVTLLAVAGIAGLVAVEIAGRFAPSGWSNPLK